MKCRKMPMFLRCREKVALLLMRPIIQQLCCSPNIGHPLDRANCSDQSYETKTAHIVCIVRE